MMCEVSKILDIERVDVRYPINITASFLLDNDKTKYEAKVGNVSRVAAGLQIAQDKIGNGDDVIIDVRFITTKSRPIERDGCHLCRNENKGYYISFEDSPLYDNELAALAAERPESEAIKQIASVDYQDVSEQIRYVQSCRSHIFIGSLAAVAAATMTTGVIIASLTTYPMWVHLLTLILGSLVGGILLTIGIMATIEKARAINYRKAFRSVLGSFLLKDSTPPLYAGWASLETRQKQCRANRENGICPFIRRYNAEFDEYEKKKKKKKPGENIGDGPELPETCWTIGKEEGDQAYPDLKQSLIPSAYDSFMSLSGFVYAALYLIIWGITMGCTYVLLWKYSDVPGLLVIVSAVVGLALGSGLCYADRRHVRKSKVVGKRHPKRNKSGVSPGSKFARILFWGSVIGLIPLIMGATIFKDTEFVFWAMLGLAGLPTAILAAVAVIFIDQLGKVQKGIYSVRSLSFSWRRVLLSCHYKFIMRPRGDLEYDHRKNNT